MRADENSLNPIILASRKDLETMLLDEQQSSLLLGWRYSMVGKELQGLLQGQYALTLNAENVFLTENS
jgi:ribonuclease D